MVFIRHDAMLRHGHDTTGTPGCGGIGSAPVRGRAAVCAGSRAGRGDAGAGGESADRASVVSPVAPRGPAGVESGGPAGPEATARPAPAGPGGDGPAPGAAAARLRHRTLDAAARRDGHRPADRGALSSGPRLVPLAGAAVVAATARAARTRAGRSGDSAVGPAPLASSKKNARRQRAWIVFEDESGVSQQPVVRRTWAPRGQTPCLRHTGANWKRLSIAAALALIWDGLGAHKSGRMMRYLHAQRRWLQVERLPAYAPELNPVELLWGNLKARESANLCPADIAALRSPVRAGCTRIRRQPALAFAFLHHAGIGL